MRMPTLKRRWTVTDLEDLPDRGERYEIIDGALFVTPAPSLDHQAALGHLHRLLAEYLDANPIGYAFLAPADVIFSPRRAVQPDVFVLPLAGARRPHSFDEVKRLLLVVEVLSPTTARADRVAKRTLYREENVAEYWILDLDSRTIDRSTPADSRVDAFADQIEWRPAGTASPLVIDLPGYFARVLDR